MTSLLELDSCRERLLALIHRRAGQTDQNRKASQAFDFGGSRRVASVACHLHLWFHMVT